MNILFNQHGWNDYLFWVNNDKKVLKRINSLIKDIQRTPFEGLGKPEPLKHHLKEFWSRRINQEHRLVYRIEDKNLYILQCRFHYDK